MTARDFFKLSAVLVLEIFIAYGMIFVLEEAEEIAEIANFPQAPAPARALSVIGPVVQDLPEEPSQPLLQDGLANPPEIIKAVYLTSWSAGTSARIDYVANLAKTTELNAVVIDIKDFSGEIAYFTNVPEAFTYGAHRIKIGDIEALLKRLHEEGLYVIARVTVFQDPVLARARPDLAVQSIAKEGVWADYKGLAWVDPASRQVWNYIVSITRDAASRGFDEINFDYVRFPSDGNLQDMRFPVWDGRMPQQQIIREFFAYLREHLSDVTISADLFGLSTSSRDDLGIGQIIEDAFEYFDYVYPMVYPSHYADGYRGYWNPAEYPYEVVHFSLASAQVRLAALRAARPERQFAKLRPWLQDFHLGATYDPLMVQAQVQATKDALGDEFTGFLLWAPTNWYTQEALNPFSFDRAAYELRPRD
ncbi:MAG: hypothetical protein A2109_01670 [Candidatus Wildermuthbacteria bacterium GWA1_49_26]|uniref:DUF4015 domain-containing protein n=1 Tax=Candidatus Yanofskybacteria bacterium GW2011_GWC1_48_11 TaxID=1619027 RepID=A0A837IPS5_9BACT|nr:MAG: hypothetical protein UY25_C0003G0046 [Candidatus Yanofskybacteria bacterium GW2011_GWC1_48_11]KKW08425.1 MAG: hypothetical protein UY45_C0007G0048 [Parcubacteria group bacterium GW2011_GWA1_49_26]KKW14355.1 MAG: hypothetical protein UY53_C0001G0071 [Parcubacteria group bacterium GW2011_GWA2_50_10]OHA61198.1 MAG: hypothetical protein A2109_01670 [Candidatus Wildermuthbacteria bacterium GWA1_49_26]OHA65685.1 MAG: hypothetical protein A2674_03695 [Candidatus Wildermuthbacteria bacterium RI